MGTAVGGQQLRDKLSYSLGTAVVVLQLLILSKRTGGALPLQTAFSTLSVAHNLRRAPSGVHARRHTKTPDPGGRPRPPGNIGPPVSRSVGVGRAHCPDHVDGPQTPPGGRAHRGTLAPSPVGRARPPEHEGPRLRWRWPHASTEEHCPAPHSGGR